MMNRQKRRFTKGILLLAAVCSMLAAVGTAGAEVRPAKVFADHMVLQREMKVPVWGWAAQRGCWLLRRPELCLVSRRA